MSGAEDHVGGAERGAGSEHLAYDLEVSCRTGGVAGCRGASSRRRPLATVGGGHEVVAVARPARPSTGVGCDIGRMT